MMKSTKTQAEINAQWSKGSENYDRIIHDELSSFRVEGWTKKIKAQVDFKPGMLCLDTGCGPGFFSIILAKAGFDVTAIDGADGMLEKAKSNFDEYGVNVRLLEMDAHEMTFADNTFDLIVSRNVTHALRDHRRVYSNWYRVLKPGGVLLIFDANWHLSWTDDEIRKESIRRYKECILKYGSDFSGNTSFDEKKYEENNQRRKKEEHVLGGLVRPYYDIGLLQGVGFEDISYEPDITQELWDDKEKLIFGNTPMFMVRAVKTHD